MVAHSDIDHTGLTGVGGSVATDAIWDAAGDLAVGSGANTAAKLAIGAAGGALSRINGAVAWNSGTSFPGSAAAGDRYWRTDLGMEFFYDGTRWLCSCVHVGNPTYDGTIPFSASNAARMAHPGQGFGLNVWVEYVWALTNVLTTNDGTKYWTIDYSGASPSIQLSTVSNTPSTDTMESATVGQTATLAGKPVLYFPITKVSTPGNLYASIGVQYRFIAT